MRIQYLGFLPLILFEIWVWLPPYKVNSIMSPIYGYIPDLFPIIKNALRIVTLGFIMIIGFFWAIGY